MNAVKPSCKTNQNTRKMLRYFSFLTLETLRLENFSYFFYFAQLLYDLTLSIVKQYELK